jgi:hypothetical protein
MTIGVLLKVVSLLLPEEICMLSSVAAKTPYNVS